MSLLDVPVTPPAIRSPQLHRDQLVVRFVDSFFPFATSAEISILTKLTTLLLPRSPAMTAAVDALLLFEEGFASNDSRLLTQGERRHSEAVALINRDITKPRAASDNGLLGAIYALMLYEMRQPEDALGWMQHAHALCALLEVRGPSSISTPFELALFQRARQAAFIHGLWSRKANFFGKREWQDAAFMAFKGHDYELGNLAMTIPTLLNRSDEMKAALEKPDSSEILALLSEICDLERSWVAWGLRHCQGLDLATAAKVRSLVATYPDLAKSLGAEAHVFPSVLVFESFTSDYLHTYYWTCLLLIRDAMLDVSRLHLDPMLGTTIEEKTLIAKVDECADELCQALPYLATHYAQKYGTIVAHPSNNCSFIAQWYAKSGNHTKLRWYESLARNFERDSSTLTLQERRNCGARTIAGTLLMT